MKTAGLIDNVPARLEYKFHARVDLLLSSLIGCFFGRGQRVDEVRERKRIFSSTGLTLDVCELAGGTAFFFLSGNERANERKERLLCFSHTKITLTQTRALVDCKHNESHSP